MKLHLILNVPMSACSDIVLSCDKITRVMRCSLRAVALFFRGASRRRAHIVHAQATADVFDCNLISLHGTLHPTLRDVACHSSAMAEFVSSIPAGLMHATLHAAAPDDSPPLSSLLFEPGVENSAPATIRSILSSVRIAPNYVLHHWLRDRHWYTANFLPPPPERTKSIIHLWGPLGREQRLFTLGKDERKLSTSHRISSPAFSLN